MFHRTFAVAGLAALAACGGTTLPEMTPQTPLEAYTTRLTDAGTMAATLSGFDPTAFKAMPTSGDATFKGAGVLFVDPVFERDADDILLVGDAVLNADFAKGRLTGDVTNFTGATKFTAASATIIPVSGSVKIGGVKSVIGNDVDDNRTDRPNDLYADYRGTVGLPDGQYRVNGTVNGQFLGTRTADGAFPIKGLYAVGEGVATRGTEGQAGFVEYGTTLEIVAKTPR